MRTFVELAACQKRSKLHGKHARGNFNKLLHKVAREGVQYIGGKLACAIFGEQRTGDLDKWKEQLLERQRVARFQVRKRSCCIRREGGVSQSRRRFQHPIQDVTPFGQLEIRRDLDSSQETPNGRRVQPVSPESFEETRL